MVMSAAAVAAGPTDVVSVPGRIDHVISNSILYVTSGATVVRYDLNHHQSLSSFNIGGNLAGVDISPDGRTLAIADMSTYGTTCVVHVVDVATGVDSPVSFPLAFAESGTYMVVWAGESQLLVSSLFAGSGWVPLRRYDLGTGQTQTIATITGGSMLAASVNLTNVGVAQADISSGPVSAYSVSSGSIVATTDTDWFMFEVSVSPDGTQFFAPSYHGAFVFDLVASAFQPRTILGQYASHGPIGGVYSPISPHLFTAEYDYSAAAPGVKVYDASTFVLVQSVDTYPFNWTGNGSFNDGRTKISDDGHWLGVSAGSTVRIYDVSAITNAVVVPPPIRAATPTPMLTNVGLLLVCLAILCVAWFQSRSRIKGK
jgi:hypothetical protein